MNNIDLPPLPSVSSSGPEVCSVVRLYLAVWDDLAPVQKRQIAAHVQACADCAREQSVLQRATLLTASLEASEPSERVDRAVMAAIAARSGMRVTDPLQPAILPQRRKRRRGLSAVVWVAATAAVLFMATFASLHFFGNKLPGLPGGITSIISTVSGGHSGVVGTTHTKPTAAPTTAQAFSIPANISWKPYVLYYTQTEMSSAGQAYQVTAYHDMSSGNMRVETTMNGKMDVVMVKVNQKALGMDMMHNVAAWGANAWSPDDSMFNLKQLRQALQNRQAVYQGTELFNGQTVYKILWNGDVLLLNTQYLPVNVLANARGSSTGAPIYKPMYNTFQVLQSAKVPDSTWDQTIPANFKMGTLPQKPQAAAV